MIRVAPVALFALQMASMAAGGERCAIDPSMAISWTKFETVKSREAPPVIARYEGCGRTLTYVAAEHSNDPNGKTFALVKTAFEKAKPKILVLEGFPSQWGENPKALIEHSIAMAGTPGDAEPYFSVRLAIKGNARFIGGEPKDSDILTSVGRQGGNASDLFALYVLRNIEQWIRSKEIVAHTDPKLAQSIAGYVQVFSRDSGVPQSGFADVSTLDGFKGWYKRTNGVDFDTGYRPQDAWPPSSESNRKTNALIAQISDIRDQHILAVIGAQTMKYGDVMIVYGASHFDIQAPSLDAAFGPPAFSR